MTEDTTKAVRGTAVKEIIDMLERKFGSLRKAAEALDIDHQKLSFWRSKAAKQREFLEELERIRKALGLSESKMWKLIKGGK